MIEIQIHPSDIRRKVRYLFISRRLVTGGILAGTFLLATIIASMTVAPTVLRRLYRSTYLHMMRQEQAVEVERLRHHVDEMAVLEKSLDQQRLEVEKLVTVYGLHHPVLGQGGTMLPDLAPTDGPTALLDARRRERQLADGIAMLDSQVEIIHAFEKDNAELVRHIPSILPLPTSDFVLTSPFGQRISPFTRRPDVHRGLDLAAAVGTPVFATADGTVTFAGRYPLKLSVAWWRFGNVVVLRHGGRFITIYAHLHDVRVKAGQEVHQGEVVGSVGSTGWSTNPHLHYEVRTDLEKPGVFKAVDPRIYILDYHWSDEEKLLIESRSNNDFQDLDPLPTAFLGRRRV